MADGGEPGHAYDEEKGGDGFGAVLLDEGDHACELQDEGEDDGDGGR